MTMEEVKIGLRKCGEDKCTGCPYRSVKKSCVETLIRDAGEAIRRLETEIKVLKILAGGDM
jgi:hypothetical protein